MTRAVLDRDVAVRALLFALGYQDSARSAQGYWLVLHRVHALPLIESQLVARAA